MLIGYVSFSVQFMQFPVLDVGLDQYQSSWLILEMKNSSVPGVLLV